MTAISSRTTAPLLLTLAALAGWVLLPGCSSEDKKGETAAMPQEETRTDEAAKAGDEGWRVGWSG